jgi:hypothetical protein
MTDQDRRWWSQWHAKAHVQPTPLDIPFGLQPLTELSWVEADAEDAPVDAWDTDRAAQMTALNNNRLRSYVNLLAGTVNELLAYTNALEGRLADLEVQRGPSSTKGKQPQAPPLDLGDIPQRLHHLEVFRNAVEPNSSTGQHIVYSDQIPQLVANALANTGVAAAPGGPVAPIAQDPKIPTPAGYDGKRGTGADNFITQMDSYFTAKPRTYPTGATHVAFTFPLLSGQAQSWHVQRIRDPQLDREVIENPLASGNFVTTLVLADWDLYKRRFLAMFGDPHRGEHAAAAFDKLRQTGSATKYASEFTTLAIDAQYDLNSRQNCDKFFNGLKVDVQNGLAVSDWKSWDFATLQRQAMDLDERLYNVKKSHTPASSTTRATTATPYVRATLPAPATSVKTSVQYGPGQGPMDLSATSVPSSGPHGLISQEERERRRKLGLCMRCAVKGHFAVDCPLSKKPVIGAATTSVPVPEPTPYAHIEPAPSESGKE